MIAYIIKHPSGLMDEESVRGTFEQCIDDYERMACHCWQELEMRGFQCVPVKIEEIEE